jgi:hypothetical protein
MPNEHNEKTSRIQIPTGLAEQLREFASARGITVQEAMRRLMDAYLRGQEGIWGKEGEERKEWLLVATGHHHHDTPE